MNARNFHSLLITHYSLLSVGPFDQGSAPGEAPAESGQHDIIALVQLVPPFPEAEGDSGSRSIAIALDIQHYLIV